MKRMVMIMAAICTITTVGYASDIGLLGEIRNGVIDIVNGLTQENDNNLRIAGQKILKEQIKQVGEDIYAENDKQMEKMKQEIRSKIEKDMQEIKEQALEKLKADNEILLKEILEMLK